MSILEIKDRLFDFKFDDDLKNVFLKADLIDEKDFFSQSKKLEN